MYAVTLKDLVYTGFSICMSLHMCTVYICLVLETNVIGIYKTNNELFEFTKNALFSFLINL